MDEKQAIYRLKQGDIRGLELLVDRFQVKAVRVAYLITRDLGLAEEIVQESFVKAYRSIRTFEENRSTLYGQFTIPAFFLQCDPLRVP